MFLWSYYSMFGILKVWRFSRNTSAILPYVIKGTFLRFSTVFLNSGFITDCIRSMGEGKVFTGVCLSTGESDWRRDLHGGGSAWRGQTPLQADPLPEIFRQTPRYLGKRPQIFRQTPLPQDTVNPGIRSIRSRYASYWNAFLFSITVNINFVYLFMVNLMKTRWD